MSETIAGPLLAIESSTPTASIAIGDGGGVLVEISLTRRGGHSAALLPAVQHAIDSVGLTPGDLCGVVIGGGPGSFTGLRVAGAMGKGIARALDLPLFAYSGLMATAAQFAVTGQPVCALFDARGQDVFAACYRFGRGVEVLLPPIATSITGLASLLDPTAGPPLLVGDGAIRHREVLEDHWGPVVAPPHFATPRAAALLWLTSVAPERGRIRISDWEPNYLRASGAERIAAARSSAREGR